MIEINGRHADEDAVRRFASKIRVENGHWRYTGNSDNAALTAVEGGQIPTTARRIAWAIANGGIREGRRVWPVCGESWCCNPSHLQAEPEPEPEVARRLGLA